MRPIDADALIKGKNDHEMISTHLIFNAPTLDGIFIDRWVPVSERLPEKNGQYLAYIINPYDEKIQYLMTCYYYAKDNQWIPDDETASDNVIAWMPLPKPYKESGDKE